MPTNDDVTEMQTPSEKLAVAAIREWIVEHLRGKGNAPHQQQQREKTQKATDLFLTSVGVDPQEFANDIFRNLNLPQHLNFK